ncbi:type II CAAX prenyl endopeptidase Rce1 family protein [Maricaulis maris]|uniref:CPBP family glutamic-type intramembrane protease n=1 Tax=Maricaulis maris TaxID=74318 RepID=UPI003B8D0F84
MGIYNTVIVESIVLLGLCLVAAILLRGRVHWGWLGGAIALYAVHKFLLFLGVAGLYPDILPGRYNWEGKIAGTVLVLVAGLMLFRGDRAAFGLTLAQSGPAPRTGFAVAAFTAIATALFMWLYWPGVKSEPLAEWTYQLTMPSLDEELLYRGVLLLMLERAFRPTVNILGAPLGFAALIVTAQFYVTHALGVGPDWSISFVWGEIVPLIYAALWIHVRVATGSLLLPILLHSWANTAGYLI